MNNETDTHGVQGTPWIGFDLDGTLAVYEKWEGIDRIGKPVEPMVARIKKLRAEGKRVKILTARVAPRPNSEMKPNPHLHDASPDANSVYGRLAGTQVDPGAGTVASLEAFYKHEEWDAKMFIIDWCVGNLGFVPEITHEKDHLMVDLYDDRVTQVIPNTGILVEDALAGATVEVVKLRGKLDRKFTSFVNGIFVGSMIFALVSIGYGIIYEQRQIKKDPGRARLERVHDDLCKLLRDWPYEDVKTVEREGDGK